MNPSKKIFEQTWVKVLSAIITLVGVFFTVYAVFQRKDPQLRYVIQSEYSVFNNEEELSSLRIFVDTINIRQNDLNVSMFIIRVENKGTKHITSFDYDDSEFGLLINDGILLDAPSLSSASTEYIFSRINECGICNKDNTVEIPKIPLDIGDYYVIKIPVLHNKANAPFFTSMGKITGQHEILINTEEVKAPFLYELIQGSFWVHICRFFIYFCLLFIIALIGIVVSELFNSSSSKRKFNKAMAIIDQLEDVDSDVKDDVRKYGVEFLHDAYYVVSQTPSAASSEYKTLSTDGVGPHMRLAPINMKDVYAFLNKKGYIVIDKDECVSFVPEKRKAIKRINGIFDTIGIDTFVITSEYLKKIE